MQYLPCLLAFFVNVYRHGLISPFVPYVNQCYHGLTGLVGNIEWKKEAESHFYDWRLIEERLSAIKYVIESSNANLVLEMR